MQKFLECAKEAASIARNIIATEYDKNAFKITIKADMTPVTEVDVAVEQAIRAHISKHFPDHGFFGEEEGKSNIDSDYVWLVDPIDGTKAFVRRRPFFSCQIALMYKGEIILGVSTAPSFNNGEQFYAVRGEGAFRENGERLSVSDITEFSNVVLSSGNLKSLAQDAVRWNNYGELIKQVNSTRGFGDFLHYHLLAQGSLDLIVESDVNILDIAALSIIVEEAGGVVTTLEGDKLSLETSSILAATPEVHAKTLKLING